MILQAKQTIINTNKLISLFTQCYESKILFTGMRVLPGITGNLEAATIHILNADLCAFTVEVVLIGVISLV